MELGAKPVAVVRPQRIAQPKLRGRRVARNHLLNVTANRGQQLRGGICGILLRLECSESSHLVFQALKLAVEQGVGQQTPFPRLCQSKCWSPRSSLGLVSMWPT